MSALERCLQSEASSSYWERRVEIGGAGALEVFSLGCRRNCILVCRLVPAMLRCADVVVRTEAVRRESEAVGCLIRRWDERSGTVPTRAGASQRALDAKRRCVPKDEGDSFVVSNKCSRQFSWFNGHVHFH